MDWGGDACRRRPFSPTSPWDVEKDVTVWVNKEIELKKG